MADIVSIVSKSVPLAEADEEALRRELDSKNAELHRMRELQTALEQQLTVSKKEILRLKWQLGTETNGEPRGDVGSTPSPLTPVPAGSSPSLSFTKPPGGAVGVAPTWGPVGHRTPPLVSPLGTSSRIYRGRSISDHTSTLPQDNSARPLFHQTWHPPQDLSGRRLPASSASASVAVVSPSISVNQHAEVPQVSDSTAPPSDWITKLTNSSEPEDHSSALWSKDLAASPGDMTSTTEPSVDGQHTGDQPYQRPSAASRVTAELGAVAARGSSIVATPEEIAAIRRCVGDRQLNRMSNNLLSQLLPTEQSERHRMRVLDFIKSIVKRSLGAQVYPHGSFALKTYLPHDTMHTSAFFSRGHENSWVQRVVTALCQEANSGDVSSSVDADDEAGTSSLEEEKDRVKSNEKDLELDSDCMVVESVSIAFRAHATPGPIRSSFKALDMVQRSDDANSRTLCCRVGGTNVCITGNGVGDLSQLGLFEEADRLVDKGHLLKRTILLVKMWAVKSGIFADDLLSDETVHALVLAVFNAFHVNIVTPLEGLYESASVLEDHGDLKWKADLPVAEPLLSKTIVERYAATIQQSTGSSLSSSLTASPNARREDSLPQETWAPFTVLAPLQPRRILTGRCSTVNRAYILEVFKRAYQELRITCLDWTQHSDAELFLTQVFDARYLSEFGMQLSGASVVSDTLGLTLLSSHTFVPSLDGGPVQQDTGSVASTPTGTNVLVTSAAAGVAESNSVVTEQPADSLQADLSIIESQLTHARQFQTPDISEEELVSLVGGILTAHGPVPVGRMGSLLHDVTNNHSLPAMIKERYGGLKRFLESHRNVFVLGDDHPYNPHVSLKSEFTAGTASAASATGTTASASSSPNMSKQRKNQRAGGRRRGRNRSGSGSGSALGGGFLGTYQSVASKSGSDARSGPLLTTFIAMECSLATSSAGPPVCRVAIVNYSGDIILNREADDDGSDYGALVSSVGELIEGRIVVGHGVSHYLQLLGLAHPASMIRDTALFRGLCPHGPLPLHRLMKDRMGINVQRGPDVVEDARAALILYKSCRRDWEQHVAQIGSDYAGESVMTAETYPAVAIAGNGWPRSRPRQASPSAGGQRGSRGGMSYRPRAYSGGQSLPVTTSPHTSSNSANRRSHSHQGYNPNWQHSSSRYGKNAGTG